MEMKIRLMTDVKVAWLAIGFIRTGDNGSNAVDNVMQKIYWSYIHEERVMRSGGWDSYKGNYDNRDYKEVSCFLY